MHTSIVAWRNWLQLLVAATTVTAYVYELERLSRHYPECDPRALTFDDLTAYLAARRATGAGQSAIYRATCAIRSFFKFHFGVQSPAARLPLNKPPIRQQRSLTFDQVSTILAACDTSTPIGRRDLALVAFMTDTAFRAAEVCRIEVDKVNLTTRLAYVVETKGGQEGFGAFSEETATFCTTWLADRAAIARCSTFFVGFEGHRPGEALTPEGLRCIMRRIGHAAGVPLSPHDLRRTYATLSSLLGAPSRLVQVGGRWRNLSEVQRYTPGITAEAMKPYSPISAVLRGTPLDR